MILSFSLSRRSLGARTQTPPPQQGVINTARPASPAIQPLRPLQPHRLNPAPHSSKLNQQEARDLRGRLLGLRVNLLERPLPGEELGRAHWRQWWREARLNPALVPEHKIRIVHCNPHQGKTLFGNLLYIPDVENTSFSLNQIKFV